MFHIDAEHNSKGFGWAIFLLVLFVLISFLYLGYRNYMVPVAPPAPALVVPKK